MARPELTPPLSILSVEVADANETAKADQLAEFVERLVREWAHLWPASRGAGKGRYTTPKFPACWRVHPAFRTMLQIAKDWDESLKTGQGVGGFREVADLIAFVRGPILGTVRDIGVICVNGLHVDPAVPSARDPLSTPAAPPLPWQREVE